MIETTHQGLKAQGYTVSISKLCRWLGMPRRTVYYRPVCHPHMEGAVRASSPVRVAAACQPHAGQLDHVL